MSTIIIIINFLLLLTSFTSEFCTNLPADIQEAVIMPNILPAVKVKFIFVKVQGLFFHGDIVTILHLGILAEIRLLLSAFL